MFSQSRKYVQRTIIITILVTQPSKWNRDVGRLIKLTEFDARDWEPIENCRSFCLKL